MSGVLRPACRPFPLTRNFFEAGTSKCRRSCQSSYARVIVITKMAVYKGISGSDLEIVYLL